MDEPESNVPDFQEPEPNVPNMGEVICSIREWSADLIGRSLEDEPTCSRKQVGPSEKESIYSAIAPLHDKMTKSWLVETSDGERMVKASLIPGRVRIIGPNTPGATDCFPTRMNITIDEERTITKISFG
ncbi:hypothetical protein GGF49_001118 [Coemansia sp. RSA 1853]|nr:hypothetical protein GGF49_001118 [Coemansia sp. RSA 1853]